jgi:cytochrome bd ubiquinol oxidase subunit I
MSNLLAARSQMAISLGFHIVFTCISMTMPWLMATAEWRYQRTGKPIYRELSRTWSKGVAVFFAVGAVSGTVLSFELGLLWPTFMKHAGPIIGLPFSWEGTAFFTEAIALGLFLYGWKRLPTWAHFASGLVVGIAGLGSGVLVIAANGFMNSPAGFRWVDGHAVDIDPVAAMFNDAWLSESIHMLIAAFAATGFGAAGVHAIRMLRRPERNEVHRHGMNIALAFGAVAALVQPISGDFSAKDVAKRQPAKLAAMEALYVTQHDAPLLVGGVPDDATKRVVGAIEIPYMLSFLAKGDPHAEVTGLDHIPRDEWPPTLVCHIAFQIMVALGTLMAGIGASFLVVRKWKPRLLADKRVLAVIGLTAPLGFIAVEAGWTVTEVGRQPWIINGIMRTADAVSPMPGLVVPMVSMTLVYALLAVVTWVVMMRLIHAQEATTRTRLINEAHAAEQLARQAAAGHSDKTADTRSA